MATSNGPIDAKPAEAAVPDGFVSLNAFFKFETPGEVLAGVYLGYETVMMDNGSGGKSPVNQYTVYNDASGVLKFNGSAQLKGLQHLPAGVEIRVVFRGEMKNGTRRVGLYDLQVKKAELATMVAGIVSSGGIKPPAQIAAGPVLDDPMDDPRFDSPPHPADA